LLSKEKNTSDVKKVYSHPQALNQCFYFCDEKNISQEKFVDTALAAKMISESDEK
jgi:prephenate dehydratase